MSEQKFILEHLRAKAYAAHSGTSFSPEKRAEGVISGYSAELERDLLAIPERARDRYIKKYTELLSAWLDSRSGIFSTMIAGPSNFPVARMKKKSQWAENRANEFRAWRKRALKAIAKAVERNKTPEQKDEERWEKIRSNIIGHVATIISIDGGDPTYDRKLFVSAIVGTIKTLAKEGNVDLLNKALNLVRQCNTKGLKPIITDKHAIWKLVPAAQDVQHAKAQEATRENEEKEINGIRIVYNYQADRVQIFFRDKSHGQLYRKAIGKAWHWTPTITGWQRKLTNNAKYDADRIAGSTV